MQKLESLLSDDDYISLIELSQLLCVPETVIVEWIDHEVICAKSEQGTFFIASHEITKAKCAVRLTRDLGINASGIAVILQMRQKIMRLEAIINQDH